MASYVGLMIAVFLLASPLRAGQWWEKVSDISLSRSARLETKGQQLFLFDRSTVYLSSDQGTSWTSLSNSFPKGVIEVREVGGHLFAFSEGAANGEIAVRRSEDQGKTWKLISSFRFRQNADLEEVCTLEYGLYAISNKRSIVASWDGGSTWHEKMVSSDVGDILDFAATESIWVACGTEGTVWSSDAGETWHKSMAPVEVGSSIFHVEAFRGTIWAGGRLGACTFDVNSRSWNPVNEGLPVYASLVGQPTALTARGGVLFGVFKTFDGTSRVMRRSAADSKWMPMESTGLPPHNLASRRNFAVMDQNLFVYYFGDDVGFVGLYKGVNDAPTSIEEENVVSTFNVTAGPLPAYDHVNVAAHTSSVVDLTIVDMTGQTVYTETMTDRTTIDIRSLSAGAYTIVMKDAKGVATTPLVITR